MTLPVWVPSAPADLLGTHMEEYVGGRQAQRHAAQAQRAGLGHKVHTLQREGPPNIQMPCSREQGNLGQPTRPGTLAPLTFLSWGGRSGQVNGGCGYRGSWCASLSDGTKTRREPELWEERG